MTKNIIVDLSMDFSIAIVNLCDNIKGKSAIINQLLRSGTSIGANIHEANYASSRADFIAKMQIMGCDINPTSYSKLEGQLRSATDKEIFVISKILCVQMENLFEK